MAFNIVKRIKNKLKYYLFWTKVALTPAKYNPKIFCIGYNKTGTTTVGRSIQSLGFNHYTFDYKVWRQWYQKGKIDKVIDFTAKFDSFDDLPWLLEEMIPLLDEKFPNSKFIYLERDEDSWQKSFYNWTKWRKGYYPDMEKSLKEFRDHKNFVENYFKDFSDNRFLVLDVKDPKGYKKLASFLGKTAPQDGFPHFNKTSELLSKK